ncbi:MAG: hydroxyisourate hydrolase [Planctomycetes bacterium]|nr:hydroxyisourate hydrolase [Planctomycetota bacterium]
MSRFSTHILDTARGCPATGVGVVLEMANANGWTEVGRGVTDNDGRVRDLLPEAIPLRGDFRLRFATGPYFKAIGLTEFYPEVIVQVRLDGTAVKYHLPLLLSPFCYSTYRGS